MHRHLDEVEFVLFDTETTGLDPAAGDRIVEIAGAKLKGEQIIGTFERLINAQRPISEGAFRINQITQEMLKGAPTAGLVIPQFLDFAKDCYLCSYNAGFDLEFLKQELRYLGRSELEPSVVLDVLKMAKKLLPGMERYALWWVAEKLDIKERQHHRALSDVLLTIKVFQKLKYILYQKGIYDAGTLISLFGMKSALFDTITNQKYAQIQEAIDLGVKLKIRYLSHANAQVTERVILPKELRLQKTVAHVIAHCNLRNEERSFRVDGILHLEIL